jgi:acylphosphatase
MVSSGDSSQPSETVYVRVRGRVQGVGFRYFTLRAAQRHGIAGWVRNRPDGDVEAEGQGSAAALQAWLDELRRGPLGGRVDQLESRSQPPTRSFSSFEILS